MAEVATCPICGSDRIVFQLADGPKSKWGAAYCAACHMAGPEVRTQYDDSENAPWHGDALEQWHAVINALLEDLAELEHRQWVEWAGAVQNEVSSERRERWGRYMVAYDALTDDVKELDREWARKVLRIMAKHLGGWQ